MMSEQETEVAESRTKFNWANTRKNYGFSHHFVVNDERIETFEQSNDQAPFLGFGADFSPEMLKKSIKLIESEPTRLKALRFDGSTKDINKETISYILSNKFHLEVLCLKKVHLGKGALLSALVHSLRANSTLKYLDLAQTRLKDYGCDQICIALSSKTSTVEDVSFSSSMLTSKAAKPLIKLISRKRIKHLNLRNNKLGTNGAIELFTALETNPNLRGIDLSFNQIYSSVAHEMGIMILKNDCLKFIEIQGNRLDDSAAEVLINAVRAKKTQLSTQFLRRNMKAMTKILKNSAQIREDLNKKVIGKINLTTNGVSEKYCNELEEILRRKSVFLVDYKTCFTWSQDAWILAKTEFGPKIIQDCVLMMGKNAQSLLDERQQGKLMLHFLAMNSFVNSNVFAAIKKLYDIGKPDLNKETDDSGKTLMEAMRLSENGEIRSWAKSLGALDGRFAFENVPPLHISSSAEIVVAKDVNEGTLVVVKIFRKKDDFDQELRVRKQLDEIMMQTGQESAEGSEREKDEFILRMIAHSEEQKKFHYVVYEKADHSLFDILNNEKLAGLNLSKIRIIARKAADCLNFLNSRKLMHGDFKPRSLMRVNYHSDDYKLIDFDGSLFHGDLIQDKFSQAYSPPELAKAKFVHEKRNETELSKIYAAESIDVWAFGVVLFELLSGTELFLSLKADDQLATVEEKAFLINWLEIPSEKLERILEIPEDSLPNRDVFYSRELVRWCLQKDPASRPSFKQILAHPFFEDLESGSENAAHLSKNFKTHLFLSHIQAQAAGTVKDVFYSSKILGCSSWLDMKAGRITQKAMHDGVKMAEAFVVCLTKDTFFSYFCLKELMWAVDFGKKILILQEVDAREKMYPFKKVEFLERFSDEETLQGLLKGLGPFEGLKCKRNLKALVEQNQEVIEKDFRGNPMEFILKRVLKEKILSVLESEDCIPYRRREYENKAMLEYLLLQIGFVPPSDPILNQAFDVNGFEAILNDQVKEEMTKRKSQELMQLRQMRRSKQSVPRGQRKMMRAFVKTEQSKRRKQRNLVTQAKQQEVEITETSNLKNCMVLVLIGEGQAKKMNEEVRKGIQKYLDLSDMSANWMEFGPQEAIPEETVKEAINLEKFAILCLMTPGYFGTIHGQNLSKFEQQTRDHNLTEFPVVMVQDGWFDRPWSNQQEEVGTKYNHFLLDVEFMPYRSHDIRVYEHEAMVGEIANRLADFCEDYNI